MILSQRVRQSSSTYENAVKFLISLCQNALNMNTLKECLATFNTLTQTFDPQSLRNVLTFFRDAAQEKADECLQDSEQLQSLKEVSLEVSCENFYIESKETQLVSTVRYL